MASLMGRNRQNGGAADYDEGAGADGAPSGHHNPPNDTFSVGSGSVTSTTSTPLNSLQLAPAYHDKLRHYEAQRRQHFCGKNSSSRLYHASYQGLLETGLAETQQLLRFILGVAAAQTQLSNSLAAINLETNNTTAGGHHSSKTTPSSLYDGNAAQAFDDGINERWNNMDSSARDGSECDADSAADQSNDAAAPITSSFTLQSLEHSHVNLQTHLTEHAELLEYTQAHTIRKLIKTIQEEMQTLQSDDVQSILVQLERAETLVEEAWEDYLKAATAVLNDNPNNLSTPSRRSLSSSFQNRQSPGGSTNNNSGSSPVQLSTSTHNGNNTHTIDLWLLEARYRVRVTEQRRCWETANVQLSEVFGSVKNTECLRRINVREYAIRFLQQFSTLFGSTLTTTSNAVLQDWAGKELSRAEVEAELDAAIAARATRYSDDDESGDEDDNRNALAEAEASADQESLLDFYDEIFGEASALQSDHLVFSVVVAKRLPDQVKHVPSLALAVVTNDSLLHLFDVVADQIALSDAPATAFAVLTHEPSLELREAKEAAARATHALTPTHTLDLTACDVAMSQEDLMVEIRVVDSSNATIKRFDLKVHQAREQIAFIAAMHGEKTRVTL